MGTSESESLSIPFKTRRCAVSCDAGPRLDSSASEATSTSCTSISRSSISSTLRIIRSSEGVGDLSCLEVLGVGSLGDDSGVRSITRLSEGFLVGDFVGD